MRLLACATLCVVTLGFVSVAQAADDPTGSWKWTTMRGDRAVETTLKLKLEGDKLTGAVSGRNNQETAIEEASYKDGEITFKVTRERNGQKFTSTYKGKVSGDTIKGTIELTRGDQNRSQPWEAKKAA